MPRGRIMGIDYGERRVGVAVTDELGLTAQALATLAAQPLKALLRELAGLVESEGVEKIVVGMPISLAGERGPAAERVEEFVNKLRAAVGVPVESIDERMTTRIAERAMGEAGVRGRRRRQVVDKVAAAVILEGYLQAASTRDETEAGQGGRDPQER
jgi:putative Holliday junction resolvase